MMSDFWEFNFVTDIYAVSVIALTELVYDHIISVTVLSLKSVAVLVSSSGVTRH